MIEPERIELKAGEAVEITWDDGRVDLLTATELRNACACAGCRSAPVPPAPADPSTCRITSIGIVGAYALNMVFAPDGHSTGIYPYPRLRELGDGATNDDAAGTS
jgi:ATP-binding protein involved in chromosome partitioning